MPLSIAVEALILRELYHAGYLMSEIGVFVLITLCTTLHQYLLLIAWEVYVGIVK